MYDNDLIKCMERFKEKRLSLGLSFQKLADKTGMSKATLQRYESGDIKNLPVDKLKILAVALETTPAYLIGWEDNDNSPSSKDLYILAKKSLSRILKTNNEILLYLNLEPDTLDNSELNELSEDILTIIQVLSTKYKHK